MTVPTDPFSFADNVGQTASGVQVNNRFALLYAALNGALDVDNMLPAVVQRLFLPGDLRCHARAAASTGWLLCDGSAVSRGGANAALFAAIGTAFGVGDGSTTFNVPDLRGRVPVGVGTAAGAAGATAHTLGQKAGEETHVLLAVEVAKHTHPNSGGLSYGLVDFSGSSTQINYQLGGSTAFVPGAGIVTIPAQFTGDGAHNNMQPYTGVTWEIKL